MAFLKHLKTYKAFYEFYNFFHQKELAHNKTPYKKYGLNKSLYKSVSSADFKSFPVPETPWLDSKNSADLTDEELVQFSPDLKKQIRNWSNNGYMIAKGLIDPKKIDQVNNDIDRLLAEQKIDYKWTNKLMFAYQQSEAINQVFHDETLLSVLSFLLGKELSIFQSINFITGSQQRAHSDSVHMTTFPLGYMIAAWVALEDIEMDQGPVFYYPGSHKMPYLLNDDFDHGGTKHKIGYGCYKRYEDQLETNLKSTSYKKEFFTAKKGDVLIWHPNLVHGGSLVTRQNATRKSMVAHYYANDVIKYHEITQRPSLMK